MLSGTPRRRTDGNWGTAIDFAALGQDVGNPEHVNKTNEIALVISKAGKRWYSILGQADRVNHKYAYVVYHSVGRYDTPDEALALAEKAKTPFPVHGSTSPGNFSQAQADQMTQGSAPIPAETLPQPDETISQEDIDAIAASEQAKRQSESDPIVPDQTFNPTAPELTKDQLEEISQPPSEEKKKAAESVSTSLKEIRKQKEEEEEAKKAEPIIPDRIPGTPRRNCPKVFKNRYFESTTYPTNPRRVNTWGWKSHNLILQAGGNIAAELFFELGGRANDIRWDIGHEFVTVTESPRHSSEQVVPAPAPSAAPSSPTPPAAAKPAPKPTPPAPKPAVKNYRAAKGEILPKSFKRIMGLAQIRQNILMVGPSGSGKTFLSGKIAEKLGLDFSAQSCSAGMSESQLAGWLLPVGDTGRFSYIPSTFVQRYENGGVFLFDEIDAADENTLIFVNAALANGRFYLPQRFENPEVKKHPDFIAVAAANTFGQGESNTYSGRNLLDAATLDRFRAGVVEVDYSSRVEKKLVDPTVLAWGLSIRKGIRDHKLDYIMSTRVMLDFTKQARELGWKMKDWEASYFADWTEDDKALVGVPSQTRGRTSSYRI